MKIKESKLREIIREALYREAGKRVVAEGRIEELFGLFGGGKKKKGKAITMDNPDQHSGQLQKAFNVHAEAISGMGAKAIPQLFSTLAKGFAKGGEVPYSKDMANLADQAQVEINKLKKDKRGEGAVEKGLQGAELAILALKRDQKLDDQTIDKFKMSMMAYE